MKKSPNKSIKLNKVNVSKLSTETVKLILGGDSRSTVDFGTKNNC
ncbi:hypothetical protein [Kordia jejudonensis]|nr:hypothetical protein [Kordia jejudonensis]